MKSRKKVYFILKLLLSACLIAWIVQKADLQETVRILYSAKVPFLLIGVIWILLDRLLMSYRWKLLLMAKGIDIPFSRIVKIYFVGAFSGNFLPSSIAPDAVRAYFASKYNSQTTDILSSIFVDRVLGLFSLSVIAIFSILYIFFDRGNINLNHLSVILAIILLIGLMTFSESIYRRIHPDQKQRILSISPLTFLWEKLQKLYVSCVEYKNKRKEVFRALFLSFVIQGLSILAVYVLSHSIDLKVSLLDLSIFVPLVNLLIMIPVSVGGIGVQEGAFIYFFSQIGISTNAALTVALLFRALTVAGSLPGGIFYILEDSGISRSAYPVE